MAGDTDSRDDFDAQLAAPTVCGWQIALALVLATASLGALESRAEACGGFFCNQQQPVRQSFERILFVDNGDGTVTAVIQIQYQGPSSEFAWLLPVPGRPEVGVSSSRVMQRLQNETAPQYNMNTTVKGTCAPAATASGGGVFGAPANTSAERSAREPDRKVEVIDGGRVGPYDFQTISVAEDAEDPAKTAIEWLGDNDYALTDLGPDLIRDYLKDGMNLVAFKLSKKADSGEIRPVEVTYKWPRAMIPIRLTAVAAQQDMGIAVWVAGPHRAIPTKYRSLELNQAAINWFQWRANYDDVVTAAAAEAGGQGFVTEFAGDSTVVGGDLFTESDRKTWSTFQHPENWMNDEGDKLFAVINAYAAWDGLTQAIREGLTLPEGVSAQDVVDSPDAYYDRSQLDIDGLDPVQFVSALRQNVIRPVRTVQKRVTDRDYLTRLYTTMSADEMEVDPVFDFNETLPDESRTHTAERTVYCGDEEYSRRSAPWKAKLPDGTVVQGEGRQWPFTVGSADDSMPAASVIRKTSMFDGGKVVEDNRSEIDQSVSAQNESVELQPGGCSTAGGRAPALPAGAALLVLVGLGWSRRDS